MWFLRFLLSVLIFIIGYVTRAITERAILPRELIEENNELTKSNMDLQRSNEALRQMLHQHVENDVERYSEKMNYSEIKKDIKERE